MVNKNSGRLQQFLEMLTQEQHDMLDSPPAMITHPQPHEANSQIMTTKFHKSMNMPAPSELNLSPSVSLRQLRLRLMFEEFMEAVEAFGFDMTINGHPQRTAMDMIDFEHIEGSRYDIIEAYDAVCDMDVINNGTAVALGFIVETGAHEVYCSNMTKLDENGKPLVNLCDTALLEVGHICGEAGSPCVGSLDPTKPVGKVLKPAHYRPANIPAILFAQIVSES